MLVAAEQMMKCDMCYDRTSAGLRPMCATVCPSQALAYVPPETITSERREVPTNSSPAAARSSSSCAASIGRAARSAAPSSP
jgi:Fe-S-cluster-containing dehydrogenase component